MITSLWADVVGYEGWYQVSSAGRVRRVMGCRGSSAGRVLTIKKTPKGYSHADLSKHDRKKRYMVHRLVAFAFLGKPPWPGAVVNHKNGVKSDNRVANLEWTTHTGNATHSFRELGRVPTDVRGERNPRSKLCDQQVAEIRALKGVVGARVLAARYGVSRSAVQFIHQGKRW